MKKRLLSFSMLILSIGLFSTKTFAQDDAGGASFQGISGSTTGTTTVAIVPPAGVRNVKRNNGDASSAYGVAEARLAFTRGMDIGNPKLVKITYLVGGAEIPNAVMCDCAVTDVQKSYISYSLSKNVNPAKKLMFHFSYSDGSTFSIPETN
ncbi:MAG TPA: hypothetical protein VMY77_15645, partial [Chitinophagaceae bacterium]|nr:hypothetical protein [Chitinophagaceae bacterium]